MVTLGLHRRANHYGVALLRFLLCWKWGMERYTCVLLRPSKVHNTSEPPDLGHLLHECRSVIRDRTEAMSRNGLWWIECAGQALRGGSLDNG